MIEFNKQHEHLFTVSYSITMACNNRCPYCSVYQNLDNSLLYDQDMIDLVIEKIQQFRIKNPDYKVKLQFKGGEPLLVAGKVVEMMEALEDDRTEFLILSNLNFKPGGSKMSDIKKYGSTNPRCTILCSVHEVSDHNFVKQNILDLRDMVETKFLLDNTNIGFVYDYAHCAVDNSLPFSFKDIRDNKIGYKASKFNFEDKRVRYLLDNHDEYSSDVTFGDKRIPAREAKEMDLSNISQQYWTICRLASFNVKYDGRITSASCGYPVNGHISKGFELKEFLCHGYECYCSTDDYKKLLRERDAKV